MIRLMKTIFTLVSQLPLGFHTVAQFGSLNGRAEAIFRLGQHSLHFLQPAAKAIIKGFLLDRIFFFQHLLGA